MGWRGPLFGPVVLKIRCDTHSITAQHLYGSVVLLAPFATLKPQTFLIWGDGLVTNSMVSGWDSNSGSLPIHSNYSDTLKYSQSTLNNDIGQLKAARGTRGDFYFPK